MALERICVFDLLLPLILNAEDRKPEDGDYSNNKRSRRSNSEDEEGDDEGIASLEII